jgi:hypothetical protein
MYILLCNVVSFSLVLTSLTCLAFHSAKFFDVYAEVAMPQLACQLVNWLMSTSHTEYIRCRSARSQIEQREQIECNHLAEFTLMTKFE